MDFTLTPGQRTVQEKARQAAEEVKEKAALLDREDRFPEKVLKLWAETGFFGLSLPKEFGGSGYDYVCYCLAQMELAQTSPSAALIVHLNHSLFGQAMALFGTPEQKRQFLPPIARGEAFACFALTEPEAGSDPSRLKTTAVQAGQEWLLTGRKNFVTSGDRARYGIVAALTDPGQGPKGISAFIAELNTLGVKRGPVEEKMGLTGAASTSLELREVRLPAHGLLGELNQGLKVFLAVLDGARVGAAAQAVGIGRAVLSYALDYARRREQFGQPLAQFQNIQWKLADMTTDMEAAALLTLKAAWLKDHMRPLSTAAAMAKRFATDAAMQAALEGVQILGGYGVLKDYPVERFFRDAKAGQIYEGTNEIMRLIIARELIKVGLRGN